jgi:hypothetical protein
MSSSTARPYINMHTMAEAADSDHVGWLGPKSSEMKLWPTDSLRKTRKKPETRDISGFSNSAAQPRVTHSKPLQLVVLALMPCSAAPSMLCSDG